MKPKVIQYDLPMHPHTQAEHRDILGSSTVGEGSVDAFVCETHAVSNLWHSPSKDARAQGARLHEAMDSRVTLTPRVCPSTRRILTNSLRSSPTASDPHQYPPILTNSLRSSPQQPQPAGEP